MGSKKKARLPWLYKRSAFVTIGVAVLIVSSSLVGYYLFTNRTKFHWYHLISFALRGDVALQRTLALYDVQFVPADSKKYVDDDLPSTTFALKWRFRPSHAVPTDPMPAVDDADRDGTPEVYVASLTRGVYALNGRNGKTLWTWKLPFGVVAGRALALVNLDKRPKKTLLLGSHTTLPIRVYALKVEKGLRQRDRLLWTRNLSGDFIDGGLNVVRNKQGAIRIIAATRDAPYSRGSLNILDARGNFVFSPVEGLDDCRSRPAIGNLNGDEAPDLIHGSHKFYNAKYGFMIVAREVDSGKVLWKKDVGFDTGFTHHAILDYDGDGKQDVLALSRRETVALDGMTGEIRKRFPLHYLGHFRNEAGEHFLLMRAPDRLVLMRANGTIVYSLKRGSGTYIGADSFAVRLKSHQKYSLMVFSHEGGKLYLTVYDLETGQEKEHHRLNFDSPPKGPGTLSAWFQRGRGSHWTWTGFVSLADVDADGFWEVLFLAEDYLYAIDTPFEIAEGYNPYAPIPYRNISNAGIIFFPDKEDRFLRPLVN